MRRVIIVSNGKLDTAIIKEIARDDYIIGVDRAAFWLIEQGIKPDVAVGDFDSTTKEELKKIHAMCKDIRTFPPEKDFTDTELALRVASKRKPKSIVIYGGSGTRLDHTLGVLHLVESFSQKGISVTFRDTTNDIQIISRGRTILTKREGYRYVSILPITNTIQISLLGLKYPLNKKTIHRGQTIGISNEFMGSEAEVVIHSGRAYVIQSRD